MMDRGEKLGSCLDGNVIKRNKKLKIVCERK